MKFISDVTFPLCPGKSVNPNFQQYQTYRNNDKFSYCLEIPSKTDARISISHHGPVNKSTPTFQNINLTKRITNLPVVSNVTEIWLQ